MEEKTIISEGRTTEEAISNGLKELNTTRDNVDIKVIEEPTKRFFSILAPRVVKVELKLKQSSLKNERVIKKQEEIDINILQEVNAEVEQFLKEFFETLGKSVDTKTEIKDNCIFVSITGSDLGFLIGYRGETLDAIQTLVTSYVNNRREEHIKVMVDIENYRQKREKTLVNLAKSIASTVIRERKSITLEPMTPLERKIIHSTLQNNNKVETVSIGEEPYRKVVISLKK